MHKLLAGIAKSSKKKSGSGTRNLSVIGVNLNCRFIIKGVAGRIR